MVKGEAVPTTKVSQTQALDPPHPNPSQQNIRGTILATEEYETMKASGTDVKTTTHPASAPGGIPFFNKGIADSSMDLASDKWKQDVMPQYMDATDTREHCVAEGQGAFSQLLRW
jgi:hypothetical protein